MGFDLRLVKKGRPETLQPLIEQARYSLALARQHAAVLAEDNWQPSQTDDLAVTLEALGTDKVAQLAARLEAKDKTRSESSAVTEAKALINRVRNTLPQVLRKHPDLGVAPEEFHAGDRLARAAGRVSAYLLKIRAPAAKLDAAFAPYLKQQTLTKLIDDAREKLDNASTAQEVDLASLPEDTAQLHERKGHLLELIEDLNAIARNAFADQPSVRAQFNKDLLNRGRKAKPAPEPTPPTT
ncbi:MAG: hypothetical protein JNJ59_00110 [Deltaproteobacteria bacterium]|nr:hypothetical protein [Deltaproteobacteria bacterium]